MKKLISLILLSAVTLSACSEPVSTYQNKLTKENLEESLSLGTAFLLAHQKTAGNFNYSYDFVSGTLSEDDNQVRQAGALWGLTLLYAHEPSPELEAAILKGFNFYEDAAIPSYPGDEQGSTESLALLCLSLLEFLSVDTAPNRESYEELLTIWLGALVKLQNNDKEFYGKYDYETGEGKNNSSPYSDGEALLTFSKAANHFEKEGDSVLAKNYFTFANEALDSMWQDHVVDAQEENLDSDETKGFYQWSIMSLYELDKYQRSQGDVDTQYVDKAVELAYWMIDVHAVLDRTRNTAYAFEGLISAYKLAKLYNEDGDYNSELDKLYETIDTGLAALTSWQVGHSLQNKFIETNAEGDALAQGGITNAADEGDLRIDVTQHQMHVVIMALEWIYQ